MPHSIATIINYCSNDYQFLRPNIKQVKKFSQQNIVPICDHFYDGSPENTQLISRSRKENPQAQFIPFKYNPRAARPFWRGWQFMLRNLGFGRVWGAQYWICYARRLGFKHVNQKIDYILFLDADEIIDGRKFLHWLNTNQYKQFNALKPANYWYWRSPRYQATTYEDSALLAEYSALQKAVFMDHDERNATFNSIHGSKTRMVLGLDNQPMIHHYGWAKPKKNLIKKVQTWGHRQDRNWTKLIETEFSHPFSGTDFIYRRRYQTVPPFYKGPSFVNNKISQFRH